MRKNAGRGGKNHADTDEKKDRVCVCVRIARDCRNLHVVASAVELAAAPRCTRHSTAQPWDWVPWSGCHLNGCLAGAWVHAFSTCCPPFYGGYFFFPKQEKNCPHPVDKQGQKKRKLEKMTIFCWATGNYHNITKRNAWYSVILPIYLQGKPSINCFCFENCEKCTKNKQ